MGITILPILQKYYSVIPTDSWNSVDMLVMKNQQAVKKKPSAFALK